MPATEIIRLDPADAAGLRRWNSLMRTATSAGRRTVWWPSPEDVLAQFTRPRFDTSCIALLARSGRRSIGGAEVILTPGSPTAVELAVVPEHRRRGVGTALVRAIVGLIDEAVPDEPDPDSAASDSVVPDRRLLVQAEAHDPGGIAFAEACGLSIANEEERLLLDLGSYLAADADRYKTGAAETGIGPSRPAALDPDPDWAISSWTGPCPEDLVGTWARLRTQMDEDVPLGELTRPVHHADIAAIRTHEEHLHEQGWILVRSLAQLSETPPGGAPPGPADALGIGYTELMVSTNDHDIVIQDDTLVDRAHRGRGIGRALKIANLRQLHAIPAAASATWVQTHTAITNGPMLALNRDLGFVPVETVTALEGRLRAPTP